jgi:hypothetical protein
VYKLRHFAVFLFQTLNDHVEGLREFASTGRTLFASNLSAVPHSEGVKLLLRAAERTFFMEENYFSQGMYLQMLKETASAR